MVFFFEFDAVFLEKGNDVMVVKLEKTLYKKRPFPGMPAIRSSRLPLLVTLQRPPPVPANFLPKRRFFSIKRVLYP